MDNSLTERINAMECKLSFWRGFISGVGATLTALIAIIGSVYTIIQIVRMIG